MSKKEGIWLGIIAAVFLGGFYYYMKHVFKPKHRQTTEIRATSTDPKPILPEDKQEWKMPKELKEISANVFVDDVRMASIQDNDGIIYIYNLQTENIDEQIEFAGKGDYEGLALVRNIYYVLRSDGVLFEVQPQKGKAPLVKNYELPLKAENETESVCFDNDNNRLLVMVKTKDLHEADKKGIYSFDLKTKQMSTTAVVYVDSKVSVDDDEEGKGKGKKKKKEKTEMKPSDIAIQPATRNFYILDGPSARLFITDAKGNIKSKFELDRNILPQPEGICFSKSGDIYISSEANKNKHGMIVKFAPDAFK
jgi:uncharacterized protein YjiK